MQKAQDLCVFSFLFLICQICGTGQLSKAELSCMLHTQEFTLFFLDFSPHLVWWCMLFLLVLHTTISHVSCSADYFFKIHRSVFFTVTLSHFLTTFGSLRLHLLQTYCQNKQVLSKLIIICIRDGAFDGCRLCSRCQQVVLPSGMTRRRMDEKLPLPGQVSKLVAGIISNSATYCIQNVKKYFAFFGHTKRRCFAEKHSRLMSDDSQICWYVYLQSQFPDNYQIT